MPDMWQRLPIFPLLAVALCGCAGLRMPTPGDPELFAARSAGNVVAGRTQPFAIDSADTDFRRTKSSLEWVAARLPAADDPPDVNPPIVRYVSRRQPELLSPPDSPAVLNAARGLTADQCQCRAAAAAGSANRKEMQIRAILCDGARRGGVAAKLALLQASLLGLRAVDDRNRAAGDALNALIGLAEIDAVARRSRPTLPEIETLIERAKELRDKGVPIPLDDTSFARQRIDAADAQAQSEAGRRRLESSLKLLLGIDDPSQAIQPNVELAVDPMNVNAEAAVAEGLALRADLGVLNLLAARLDEDTVDVVDGLVSQFDGGGGGAPSRRRLLLGKDDDKCCQVSITRARLMDLIGDREAAISAEIRSAVIELDSAAQRVELASRKLASWQRRFDDLKDRENTPGFSAFQLGSARLQAIAADVELVRRQAAWQKAAIALRRSMGRLAVDCGYGG